MVALAIVNSGLSPFEPLTLHNQASPWGFVLITKLMAFLFGPGDLQFRLPGILLYFCAVSYLTQYWKRRFGNLFAFSFAFILLFNPFLLRYSTEFKHYIFEFSFAIFILVGYLEYRQGLRRGILVYSLAVALSLFFGISIIIVVSAVFTVEIISMLRISFRKAITSRWLFSHAAFFILFLVWYFVSITPNLKFNIQNYQNFFGIELDPAKLIDADHWESVYEILGSCILPAHSIIFQLSGLSAILLWIAGIMDLRKPSVTFFPLTYLFVYALNLLGLYPILLDRHLMFILPSLYLIYGFLADKLSGLFNSHTIRAAFFVILMGISSISLIDAHLNRSFFFQEFKPLLKTLAPSDRVFVHFAAQPGYYWYKEILYPWLPDPLNPPVNAQSGPKISSEKMREDFEKYFILPGAFPAVAQLTMTEDAHLYNEYMLNHIISAGKSKLVVSHRTGTQLRNMIGDVCEYTYFARTKASYILEISCP